MIQRLVFHPCDLEDCTSAQRRKACRSLTTADTIVIRVDGARRRPCAGRAASPSPQRGGVGAASGRRERSLKTGAYVATNSVGVVPEGNTIVCAPDRFFILPHTFQGPPVRWVHEIIGEKVLSNLRAQML